MDVLATCGGPIILGRTGENDYTVVVFPFDGPAGASVALFNRLPGSTSSYPVAAVEVQNSTVRWTVSSADLSVNGYGECEITYTLGDVVAKSARYPTQVIASLDGQGDPPEGWDTWQAVFTALKAQAEAAAQTATDAAQTAESASEAIQNLSVSSTTLTPGSTATVEKTVHPETGAVSLAFGIPEGQRGDKGDIGKTPDISIGTVTTGAAGSDASATMTGTAENPVLNLTIPRGDAGKDGEPGKDGEDGEDYVLTTADKAEIAQQAEELLAPALDNKAPIIINSASGDIAHFTDGADGLPVKELTINVEPVQSGSGDPSPDNVRPITGWTGAKVTRTGKNLLNLTESGMIRQGWNRAFAMTMKAGVYTLSCQNRFGANDTTYGQMMQFNDADNNLVKRFAPNYNFGDTEMAQTITLTEAEASMVAYLLFQPRANYMPFSRIANAQLQLEYGSTATSYEPYSGQTYSITFPSEAGTVYGGTLDVTNGVLTVDRGMVTYDGSSDELWTEYGVGEDHFCCVISINGKERGFQKSICNEFKNVDSAFGLANYGIYSDHPNLINTYFRMPNSDVNTRSEFLAWIAQHPIQLVYKLAAPITYQLTPQEITTLLGANNVWADTGDVSITYRADTKLFVEQNAPESPVQDVQVNGTSVVTDGVANVPVAGTNVLGVIKTADNYGTAVLNGMIYIKASDDARIKAAGSQYRPIVPYNQHTSVFYGLAKASGDTTQAASANAVGTYTDSAKSAISTMLNAPVTVTGTTPTITALAGVQYVCGEVSTLDITLPASGCVDVRFESGSTATVLTITPPSGVTVKWAGGFDPTALEANTIYEINIADGLGVAASWT